jgi:hypothetical protein
VRACGPFRVCDLRSQFRMFWGQKDQIFTSELTYIDNKSAKFAYPFYKRSSAGAICILANRTRAYDVRACGRKIRRNSLKDADSSYMEIP